MTRHPALLVSIVLAACAVPPRLGETVWVTVAQIYTPDDMQKSWNAGLAAEVKKAGISDRDIAAGRLLRVACGLATDYTWASYTYLPAGMSVHKDEVLELRIEAPSDGSRLRWNPVVGPVEGFKFPGSSRALAYVADPRERGWSGSFERLPLEPEQRGRYVIAYGEYVIKCIQDDKYQ